MRIEILNNSFAQIQGGAKATELFEGMKAEPNISVNSSKQIESAMPSAMNLLQLLFALGCTIACIKFGLPKFVDKFNKKAITSKGSLIQIEDSVPFVNGRLYVINVKERCLLIAGTPQNVTFLADLTPPTSPGMTKMNKQDENEPPAFFELFDQSQQSEENPNNAIFIGDKVYESLPHEEAHNAQSSEVENKVLHLQVQTHPNECLIDGHIEVPENLEDQSLGHKDLALDDILQRLDRLSPKHENEPV